MIMDRANIQASLDAWVTGQRSQDFNNVATTSGRKEPRRVDMSPVNDRQPGILGLR